jgi:hypothetical protein
MSDNRSRKGKKLENTRPNRRSRFMKTLRKIPTKIKRNFTRRSNNVVPKYTPKQIFTYNNSRAERGRFNQKIMNEYRYSRPIQRDLPPNQTKVLNSSIAKRRRNKRSRQQKKSTRTTEL